MSDKHNKKDPGTLYLELYDQINNDQSMRPLFIVATAVVEAAAITSGRSRAACAPVSPVATASAVSAISATPASTDIAGSRLPCALPETNQQVDVIDLTRMSVLEHILGSLVAHFGAKALWQKGLLHYTNPVYANRPRVVKWLSAKLRNAPWLNPGEILPWLITEFRKETKANHKENLQ